MCSLLQLLEISLTHDFRNPSCSDPHAPPKELCVQGAWDHRFHHHKQQLHHLPKHRLVLTEAIPPSHVSSSAHHGEQNKGIFSSGRVFFSWIGSHAVTAAVVLPQSKRQENGWNGALRA